jgi:hypothetical protein
VPEIVVWPPSQALAKVGAPQTAPDEELLDDAVPLLDDDPLEDDAPDDDAPDDDAPPSEPPEPPEEVPPEDVPPEEPVPLDEELLDEEDTVIPLDVPPAPAVPLEVRPPVPLFPVPVPWLPDPQAAASANEDPRTASGARRRRRMRTVLSKSGAPRHPAWPRRRAATTELSNSAERAPGPQPRSPATRFRASARIAVL